MTRTRPPLRLAVRSFGIRGRVRVRVMVWVMVMVAVKVMVRATVTFTVLAMVMVRFGPQQGRGCLRRLSLLDKDQVYGLGKM